MAVFDSAPTRAGPEVGLRVGPSRRFHFQVAGTCQPEWCPLPLPRFQTAKGPDAGVRAFVMSPLKGSMIIFPAPP